MNVQLARTGTKRRMLVVHVAVYCCQMWPCMAQVDFLLVDNVRNLDPVYFHQIFLAAVTSKRILPFRSLK